MIAANILFGANSVLVKLGTENMSPLMFGTIRYTSIGILIFVGLRHIPISIPKYNFRLILHGLMVTVFTLSMFYGLQYSKAINHALLLLLVPILVYMGSVFFLKEKWSTRGISGALVGMLGGLLLLAAPLYGGQESVSTALFGNALLFISIILWAGIILHTKYLYKGFTGDEIVFTSFILPGLTMFLLMLATEGVPQVNLGMSDIIVLLVAILLSGYLGVKLFYTALRNMSAGDTSSLFYLDPLSGFLLAAILLGETLTAGALIGASAIIAGILIAHPVHHHRMHYYLTDYHSSLYELFRWFEVHYEHARKAIRKVI